jgi:hypothetical protein
MEKVYRSLLRKAIFFRRNAKLTGQDGAAKPSHSGSNEGTGPSPPRSPWRPGWRSLRRRFGCQPKKQTATARHIQSNRGFAPIRQEIGRGTGFCASLVALCGVCCTAGLRGAPVGSCLHGCHVPNATWHAECMSQGILYGDCMSQGDGRMACRMANAAWHLAWHIIWRLPRGMTHGESFMFQSSSCSAAVRSVLPGHHDRPKSLGRLQVGCNRPSTHVHACRRVMHAHNQPRSRSAAAPLLLREDTRWRSLS